MKVIQIVGNSSFGGATTLILQWCKFLASKGCQVDVLSTDMKTIEELQKISSIRIIDDIFIPRNIKPINDLIATLKLAKRLRVEKYDIVQTYTASPGFVGRLAARLSASEVVLHHQAAWAYTETSSWFKKNLYLFFELLPTLLSTTNICVGDAVAADGRKLRVIPNKKLTVIKNGIDIELFRKCVSGDKDFRSKTSISSKELLIGTTGRLAKMKDYETLIFAAAELRKIRPTLPFKVLLAGDGPERKNLENLVSRTGLGDKILFLGFCSNIPQFLASIDIYVSPTLREGLSISILEAMAASKPIVVSAIPPNLELIEHQKTGLVFPPKSPEKLAHAIIQFIDDFEFANTCGVRAQQRVHEEFTIERMFQETWTLYQSLLSEKRKNHCGTKMHTFYDGRGHQ